MTNKTFKYRFKVRDRVVHYGITTDLKRREREHQRRWPEGRIERVGEPTTHREAWEWERHRLSTAPFRRADHLDAVPAISP